MIFVPQAAGVVRLMWPALLAATVAVGIGGAIATAAHADASPEACGSLAKLALPEATVTAAETVAAGTYRTADGPLARVMSLPGMNAAGHAKELPNPALCRIAAPVHHPGYGHCFGGAGCDTFDKLGTIDAWVDKGSAPERITAAKIMMDTAVRTRPLCAYPLVAAYRGSGSMDDA